MEISPLDVRSQVFKKRFQGCDTDEVKQFLDMVADRMEAILKEKELLEKENIALKEKVEAYSNMEQTLRDTLLTAQKVGTDARANAEHNARNIIEDAELDAKRKVAAATTQVDAIAKSRDMLKAETMALAAKIRSLIEAQLTFVGSMEDEVRKQGSQPAKTVHAGGGK